MFTARPHKESEPQVPGPRSRWYLGSAVEFDSDPLGWLTATHAEYGDVVRLDPTTVVFHDPALIHQVLMATNGAFLLDNTMAAGRRGRQWLLDGLPMWMDTRRYLHHGLSRSIMSAHSERAGRHMNEFVASRSGRDFDLFDIAQRLVGSAIVDYCIGADEAAPQVAELVERMFRASLDVADGAQSRLSVNRRPATRRAKQLNEELLGLLSEVVRRRRARPRPAAHRDVLDALLPRDTPERYLVASLRLMMATSHGPSGATLSWALLRLAGDPSLAATVRREVGATAMHDNQPGEAWPHTVALLKETMRLHPPNWLMGRSTTRPLQLGGYRFSAGERVLFTPYLIHRDPRFWEEPERFAPERWLGTGVPFSQRAYLPFGAGTRVCPGVRLGPVQLAMALGVLAAGYRLDLPDIQSVTAAHRTLLTPVKVRARWSRLAA